MKPMLKLQFYKYQGAGNDFILIDNRQLAFPKKNTAHIAALCDRKFGIGADGLILLENDESADFKMVYFNADGNESTLCGNGGRCTIAFAARLGIIDKKATFMAIDGEHHAQLDGEIVTLWMNDVAEINERSGSFFLNTGSPHHVQLVDALDAMDVKTEGAKLRYGLYGQSGSNINFVAQLGPATFRARTYERGVEDETLACGTGVVATALAMHHAKKTQSSQVSIAVEGGELKVQFDRNDNTYTNIRLIGPAKFVFKGEIECNS